MQSEKLTENLKKDHKLVKELIDNVFDYIATDDKKIEFIEKLKNLLVKHLENEDKYLYPFLKKEAENDTALKSKLEFFAKDWEKISEFFKYYIEKYSEGKFDDDFTRDTAKLISVVRQRMMKEEISLYTEYDRRI